MRYLAKLSNRLALLKSLTVVAIASTACSTGERSDFLSPNPDQIQPVLARIRVTPQVATVKANETFQFAVAGESIDGKTIPATVDWSAVSGGTITSDGQFTATKSGQYRVRAVVRNNSSIRDSAVAGVWEKPTDALFISVQPDTIELTTGEGVDLDAFIRQASGALVQTDALIWGSTGGSIDGSGWFTSPQVGDYRVHAIASNGVSGVALVRVRLPKVVLSRITVGPDSASLHASETRQFSATALWSDGSSTSADVLWSSTGGTISQTGLYAAGSKEGSYVVVGRQKGGPLADTSKVIISPAKLVAVHITPGSVSLSAGASQHFTAQGELDNGGSQAVSVNWQATGGSINSNGVYTAGTTAGSYRVIATLAGAAVADTTEVTVSTTAATLTQVILNPSSASVPAGATRQFSVTGVWSDGSTATPPVTWTAGGGTITSGGLYTAAGSLGTYRVIATAGNGKADTSSITVTAASLQQLSVTPANVSLVSGASQQFAVTGTWSDGSTTTPAVTWTAQGGTVSAGGMYTAGATAGTYRFVATHAASGLADTSFITVTTVTPALASLTVSPDPASLQTGGTRQFTASATWSDGSTSAPAVTWSATGGTISPSGLFTAGSTSGTYRVMAKHSAGTKADTAMVTLTSPPTLASVGVTPGAVSLAPSATQQFAATGTYSNGGTTAVTVTWTATGGTITSGGNYSAGSSAGTFRVIGRESASGKADTAFVTIGSASPVLTGIVVSPKPVTMWTGGQQQFSALAQYSNGNAAATAVTWSATGGLVSSTGVYTAGTSPGTFRVIASGSGMSDTSTVTISLTPAPGQYQTIAKKDWKAYADKAALAGMIGVEGQLNLQAPALPASDFYDLVSDPLFGKVVRYQGGPHLNPTAAGTPGRVATYSTNLVSSTRPNATWWTPPSGSASGVTWFPTHVWVRQFIRFSPTWTNQSVTGGSGSGDYKTMFLRYWNSSARHEFKVTNLREWVMGGGNPGLTKVTEGYLPWRNVETMNVQYSTSGFYGVDLAHDGTSPVKTSSVTGECSPKGVASLPCLQTGNGEWYEIVMHHKTVAERGEFTQYIRRYTVNGAVNPGTWRINASYFIGQPGQSYVGLSNYVMGVNRNRWYDSVMYHDWGPYEVVDGSVYPNPWNLPGGN